MSLFEAAFVLGAGASYPFGFPVGSDLTKELYKEGSEILHDCCHPDLIQEFRHTFRASGLPSIDQFVQHCERTGRGNLVDVGITAVASILLPAEQMSVPKPLDWLQGFISALAVMKDQTRPIHVITFNYDRSFEFLVTRALAAIHRLEQREAAAMFKSHIDMLHVYGQLGELPFFGGDGYDTVRYGDTKSVREAGRWIKTIGRDVDQDSIHKKLAACEGIVFVGFGFLEENVRLLQLEKHEPKIILSTGLRLSHGARWSLATRYPRHRWHFGDYDRDAAEYFHDIDLFRQLGGPFGNLTHYAKANGWRDTSKVRG